MTPKAAGLNTIARAEVTPAQARESLEDLFGRPSPDLLRDAYLALRAWTWKALDQRRRDAELRSGTPSSAPPPPSWPGTGSPPWPSASPL